MTLPAIFSILNNASIRRNVFLNFRKFARENKPLFWQKWTPDVFFLFLATMLVSLRRTPAWRLHTKLYKFVWNIMSNNLTTEYPIDLRLGQSPYLFIVYNVSISWLHSLNSFQFLFWWRDSENRQFFKIFQLVEFVLNSRSLLIISWYALPVKQDIVGRNNSKDLSSIQEIRYSSLLVNKTAWGSNKMVADRRS